MYDTRDRCVVTHKDERPAEHGLLCAWCYQRLARNLAELPSLLEHLRFIAASYIQSPILTTDPRGSSNPSHRTVLHPATLAADELDSTVQAWLNIFLEDHPAWNLNMDGWLTATLDAMTHQSWIDDFQHELNRDITTAKARWPTEDMSERERGIPDAPCPHCGWITLKYFPPTEYRQPFAISCMNPACCRTLTEDEWDAYVLRAQRKEPA